MCVCFTIQAVFFLQISEPVDEEITACGPHDGPSDTLTNYAELDKEQLCSMIEDLEKRNREVMCSCVLAVLSLFYLKIIFI